MQGTSTITAVDVARFVNACPSLTSLHLPYIWHCPEDNLEEILYRPMLRRRVAQTDEDVHTEGSGDEGEGSVDDGYNSDEDQRAHEDEDLDHSQRLLPPRLCTIGWHRYDPRGRSWGEYSAKGEKQLLWCCDSIGAPTTEELDTFMNRRTIIEERRMPCDDIIKTLPANWSTAHLRYLTFDAICSTQPVTVHHALKQAFPHAVISDCVILKMVPILELMRGSLRILRRHGRKGYERESGVQSKAWWSEVKEVDYEW